MTTILKDLAGQEDLLLGEGSENQVRDGLAFPVSKIRVIYPANDTTEIQNLDPNKYPKVMLWSGSTVQFYLWDGSVYQPVGFDSSALDLGLSEGSVPVFKGNALEDSGLRLLSDGSMLTPKEFTVESGSVNFGDAITISENGGFLALKNNIDNRNYILVDYLSPRSSAASRPRVLATTEAENFVEIQPLASITVTSGPYTIAYLPDYSAYVNAFHVKTAAEMQNVRITVIDSNSGTAIKYIPSKESVTSGTGGISLTAGDNAVDLGESPIPFIANSQLSVRVEADSYSMLGLASGEPYLAVTQQLAQLKYIRADGVYYLVSTDSTLANNSVYDVEFSAVNSSETITLTLENGLDAGDTITIRQAQNIEGNTLVFSASNFIVKFYDGSTASGPQLTTTSSKLREFSWDGSNWVLYSRT